MTLSESAITIRDLVKRYDRIEAVRGISLDVRRGEVFGFLGPNGAGKTTTIRCLLGLLRPTSGAIHALDMDAAREGVNLRRRVAYVPGELRLPERLRAGDFIDSIGRLRGGFDGRRRDELARRLDLDVGRRLRDLSTGNRRKVALLIAFLSEADLLILDEPTNGLDPLMQHVFLELVAEARAAGSTVFLSSHVLAEVQRAADRVAVLRDGRVVAEGTVADLRARARQKVEVWFEGHVPSGDLAALPGLSGAITDGRRFTATLTGSVEPLLQVLARHRIASLLVEEPDLDEAFLGLYEAAA
ncbi:MAG TPA: ABC transporter ATP-binding protein [Candidatus Limnocylindrales bacterium]|nr:ABC transporter ATP-binding protein [Candidatus Limnocylindrales bacterium]